MLSMILITEIRCRAPAYVGHLDRGEEELQALNLEWVRNLSTYALKYRYICIPVQYPLNLFVFFKKKIATKPVTVALNLATKFSS